MTTPTHPPVAFHDLSASIVPTTGAGKSDMLSRLALTHAPVPVDSAPRAGRPGRADLVTNLSRRNDWIDGSIAVAVAAALAAVTYAVLAMYHVTAVPPWAGAGLAFGLALFGGAAWIVLSYRPGPRPWETAEPLHLTFDEDGAR